MKLFRVTVTFDKELFDKKIKEDQEGFSKQVMIGIGNKLAEDLIHPERTVMTVGSYDSPENEKEVIVDAHFIGMTIEDFKKVYDAVDEIKGGVRASTAKKLAEEAFEVLSNKGEVKWEKAGPAEPAEETKS